MIRPFEIRVELFYNSLVETMIIGDIRMKLLVTAGSWPEELLADVKKEFPPFNLQRSPTAVMIYARLFSVELAGKNF